MASSAEDFEQADLQAIAPRFRARLLARGQARSLIWRDGILPDDHGRGDAPDAGQTRLPILGGEGMRLTGAQAIRANTNTCGAAYSTSVKDMFGSVEVGKLADPIVLDKNLFDRDPHDIRKTKVLLTIMRGKVRCRDGI